MSDPARPDPATRDLLKEAWWGALNEIGNRASGKPATTFDEWLAAKFPPPLPDEPPDGAVCLSVNGQSLWRRCDDVDGQSRWFTTGIDSMGYAMALSHGLDPGRRLVELRDDDQTVAELAAILGCDYTHRPVVSEQAFEEWQRSVRVLLRALAERGNQ